MCCAIWNFNCTWAPTLVEEYLLISIKKHASPDANPANQ